MNTEWWLVSVLCCFFIQSATQLTPPNDVSVSGMKNGVTKQINKGIVCRGSCSQPAMNCQAERNSNLYISASPAHRWTMHGGNGTGIMSRGGKNENNFPVRSRAEVKEFIQMASLHRTTRARTATAASTWTHTHMQTPKCGCCCCLLIISSLCRRLLRLSTFAPSPPLFFFLIVIHGAVLMATRLIFSAFSQPN